MTRRLGLLLLLFLCLVPVLSPTAWGQETEVSSDPVPVAVLPLGLTEATSARYPQLAERSVGFGIHNLLVDRLFDTGRFRFVEDKPEVVEDLLERQWVATTGAVDVASAVEHGRLLGARYVLYGEVFEFSTRRLRKKQAEARIGIQVRLVDVETSEYVPASGTGTVTRKGEVFPKSGDDTAFARSTVGEASRRAVDEAVTTLMQRARTLDLSQDVVRSPLRASSFYSNTRNEKGSTP